MRLYAFLSQVLPFSDSDLEKLYVFARHLLRLLRPERAELPLEVQQNIDMESFRIQETGRGKIGLERKAGVLDPIGTKEAHGHVPEEMETLSRIIAELNERFGLELGPENRVTLGQMMEKLEGDAALDAAARVNTRDNVRLTFDHKVSQVIQEIVDSNFDLYKRITDDRAFGEVIRDLLFDQYLHSHRSAEELIQRGESKTLEFKSTLRWNLVEDRKDDKRVTHAALKTIAAFLNTEGGDLLLGVADDGAIDRRRTRPARKRRQVHAPSRTGGAQRPRRPRRNLHRSGNSDRRRQGGLRGELPAQPGTGVPQVEGGGEGGGRRFLRAQRPGNREAPTRRHQGIHPHPVLGWFVAVVQQPGRKAAKIRFPNIRDLYTLLQSADATPSHCTDDVERNTTLSIFSFRLGPYR